MGGEEKGRSVRSWKCMDGKTYGMMYSNYNLSADQPTL
jgi:hypothetical protein